MTRNCRKTEGAYPFQQLYLWLAACVYAEQVIYEIHELLVAAPPLRVRNAEHLILLAQFSDVFGLQTSSPRAHLHAIHEYHTEGLEVLRHRRSMLLDTFINVAYGLGVSYADILYLL